MAQAVNIIILCSFVGLQETTSYPDAWGYRGGYEDWRTTSTPEFTTPEDESMYRSGYPSESTMMSSTYRTTEGTSTFTEGPGGSSTTMRPLSLFSPHSFPDAFRVIWNYPDRICAKTEPYVNLADYGIESNPENNFLGDTIALLYDAFGLWPKVDLYSQANTRHNGGLPQYADADGHVKDLKYSVRDLTSPYLPGFGVLDMELWRPLLETHFGRLRLYRQIQMDEVAKTHFNISEKQQWEIAKEIWNKAARYLMERSLNAVKFARPLKLWGYYGYPEYSSRGGYNDRLAWLWKITTAFYPSVYIKSFKEYYNKTKERLITILSETFRVREEYGNHSAPIMAYTVVQTPSLGRFYGRWLELAIKLPVEMGVDGLVLWSTSKLFTDREASTNCPKHNRYITKTLGPMIQKLISRMTKCSFQMCGGKGRCVHKRYAARVFFSDKVKGNKSPEGLVGEGGINPYFYYNYVCLCYTKAVDGRCV